MRSILGFRGCVLSIFVAVGALQSPGFAERIFLTGQGGESGWKGNENFWSHQDGVIVGKSDKEVPVSTFLLTERSFKDFRLTATAKLVSGDTHSGLAFWGRIAPEHGDPHTYAGHLVMFNGAWGVYDLFGRKDLGVDCSKASEVSLAGEWTDLEILAVGGRIRLAVNGVLVADWTESEPARVMEGPIGLQLASSASPQEIQFKNVVVESSPQHRLLTLKENEPNSLTVEEIANGWISLFDGKTTLGWRGFRAEAFPKMGWEVVDGSIRKIAGEEGGDIMPIQEFEDFELVFEWKVAPGANSGVMYRVSEEEERSYYTGPEYQVLDDDRHNDGKNPLTSAASIYALFAAEGKNLKPVGEYNLAKIVLDGADLEHWLNGQCVVKKTIGGDEWTAKVQDSKFADLPNFGKMPKGFIVFQDHGDDVWFRNIKIRPLP